MCLSELFVAAVQVVCLITERQEALERSASGFQGRQR